MSVWKFLLICAIIFWDFFIEKVVSTRALITAPDSDPSVSVPYTADFTEFELVTISILEDVVHHIKPAGSPVILSLHDF